MKIGFDISQTGKEKTGCGYFADSLIKEIAHLDKENQYILYSTFGNFYWDNHFDKINIPTQKNFSKGISSKTLDEAKQFWKESPDTIEEKLGEVDLLHINNFFFPEKKTSKTKFLYTLYDLSFVKHPEWTTEQNRVCCFDNIFNASINADHIIAISEYSKKHFLEIFPHYPEDQISVVYLASRYQYNKDIQKTEKLSCLSSGKFWLNVGTIEPRKNHKRLLKAYAELKTFCQSSKKEHLPLVLVGSMGWMMQDFEQYLHELNLTEDVIWLGYAKEHELQWLYQHCYCFIYPSLFEGFGLPVLEAMTCGAPVITSDTSSIPEITGNSALLIDPTKTATLSDAMKKCVEGKVSLDDLSRQSLQRSKMFSWTESAKKILNIYEKLYRST